MEIRKEETKDYAEIYEVVKRAFESAEQSDGNVQRFRKSEDGLLCSWYRQYSGSELITREPLISAVHGSILPHGI